MMPSADIRKKRVTAMLIRMTTESTITQLSKVMEIDRSEVARFVERFKKRTGIKITKGFNAKKVITYRLETPLGEALILAEAKRKNRKVVPGAEQPGAAPAPAPKKKKPETRRESPWWGIITYSATLDNQSRRTQ